MTTAEITRTEQADTITYTARIDGTDASELVITADRREVANVETRRDYQRRGLARLLWDAANADAQCFHALPHHRTDEGEQFATAVGGDTIDEQAGYQPACCICTESDTDEDEEW
jgi:hypothetical protein